MGDGNWTEPNVLECESLQFLRIRLEVFCLCCSIVVAYQKTMFQACCYLEVLLFFLLLFPLSIHSSLYYFVHSPSFFPPPILISHTSYLHSPSLVPSLPPFLPPPSPPPPSLPPSLLPPPSLLHRGLQAGNAVCRSCLREGRRGGQSEITAASI